MTRNERGLLSTELAVLMPVLFLIALLSVYVVQVERHSSRTQQAADAAARAASLVADETQALTQAQSAASAVCRGTAVIDTATWEFAAPDIDSFTPGRVAVGVRCTEAFTSFQPLVDAQNRTESATAVSVIEYWRSGP